MWKSRVELVKRFCVTTLVREREGRGNKRELTPSDEGEGLKSGNFKPNVASAYVSVFHFLRVRIAKDFYCGSSHPDGAFFRTCY